MANRIYYVPTAEKWDCVFYEQSPVCVDRAKTERLATEWGVVFGDLWEEASDNDIAEYGVYDS